MYGMHGINNQHLYVNHECGWICSQ